MRKTLRWFPFCRRFFSLSQQFIWIKISRIFVNDDADFPDDEPKEDPDWVENKDNEEDEIPALETSQILTSSCYLEADNHVWSETLKDCHGCAAPAIVPVFVLKTRTVAENLEDSGNIFHLFMDDDIIKKICQHTNEQMERQKEQRRKENIKEQSYYRDCTRN